MLSGYNAGERWVKLKGVGLKEERGPVQVTCSGVIGMNSQWSSLPGQPGQKFWVGQLSCIRPSMPYHTSSSQMFLVSNLRCSMFFTITIMLRFLMESNLLVFLDFIYIFGPILMHFTTPHLSLLCSEFVSVLLTFTRYSTSLFTKLNALKRTNRETHLSLGALIRRQSNSL